jgi:AcrR family transcriptional regulator
MNLGRVEKRKRDTRVRIAHAALELFAKKGIDATTVAEISEAADIGKGTFFTYFPTKEDVFVEVGTLILERIAASLAPVDEQGDTTAARMLERALMPGIDWHEAHPALSLLAIAVMMRQPESLSVRDPSVSALGDLLVSLVESGKASGEFRADVDAEAASIVLLGVYFMGIIDWHQSGAKRGALKRKARDGLELLLRGVVA